MKNEIILIGGGGHCKSCINAIESENKFKIIGIIDLPQKIGEKVLDYQIIGSDRDIPHLIKKYKYFAITLGQIKSPKLRKQQYERIVSLGGEFPIIVASSAYVSPYANIHSGTIILHKAFINADAELGDNCIINTGAIIEHDAIIGSHCHISTNAVVNGEAKIGNESFVGSSSVIFNGVEIVAETLISGGAVVMKDIKVAGTYMGNPARRIM